MKKYHFYTNKDIDLERIVNENPEAFGLIIVTPEFAWVTVQEKTLEKFHKNEGVIICGEPLHRNWGLSHRYRVRGAPISKLEIETTILELERAKKFQTRNKITVIGI